MSSGGAVAGGSGAQLDTGQSNAVLIVNGEHVQQCKYGGRAQANGADGGAFFAPDDPRAYPHAATLDTCATMHGAGPKKARWASQWTRAAWPEAASFVVNSSPRCCDACRMKLRRVVQAASRTWGTRRGQGERGGHGRRQGGGRDWCDSAGRFVPRRHLSTASRTRRVFAAYVCGRQPQTRKVIFSRCVCVAAALFDVICMCL